jgi:peptidyl-prolyl cis-trans isomerase D
MLQKLRQYSKSWLANIFLGLLSLAFVSWGIGDILQGRVNTAVVTVGKTAVDQSEFQRDYNNYLRTMGAQQGVTITPDMARKQHLADAVLQQTINTTALDNVVQKLGLTAGDATVTAQIRSMQQFAGFNGAFDRTVFEELISRFGYTEQGFIHAVRSDLSRAQLEVATEGGFELPAGYVRALMAYASELRAADYVVFDAASLPPIAPPSDGVLTAYIKAHTDSYSTPEYRDVTFVRISPEDVTAGLTVTDAELKHAYESRKSQYETAEKRHLERISYRDEKSAQAARAKIAAGESFLDAAKAQGSSQEDIDVGEVTADNLEPEEAKAAFAAKEGAVTDPVKSSFGWNLYHVVKVEAGSAVPLDKVRDELKVLVLKQLARSKLDDISNAYTDAVTNGLTLAEAAKKIKVSLNHVVAIDRDGLKPDGSKADAPDDAEFRNLVFKADVGEEGDPIMTKAGVLYVLQVNGLTPPKLRPFADVKAKALAAWTAEQRKILIKKRAQEMAAKASRENSLDGVAKALGKPVQHSAAFVRQTAPAEFSPQLTLAFFDAKPGTSVAGPSAKGGSYVVARVVAMAHRVPPENDPSFTQTAMYFSRNVGGDVMISLAYAAKKKQGVKIDNKLLENAVGKEGS